MDLFVKVKEQYLIKTEVICKKTERDNENIDSRANKNEEQTNEHNQEQKSGIPDESLENSNKIDEEQRVNNKRKREEVGKTKKLTLSQRHQDTHPDKENRLCSFIGRGEICPFGEKCQYSHDIFEFLSRKPEDLGPICYQFETFGYCPNGFMCRFGNAHIDKDKGLNIKRLESCGGVIERKQVNILSKNTQILLRKKKIDELMVAPKPDYLNINSEENKISSVLTNSDNLKDEDYNLTAFPDKSPKLVDFKDKVYVAPLTTVGNLPFRRIMKDFGADITCGEMSMANNILTGQASEWALFRRHSSENTFGIQVAGNFPDVMGRVAQVLEHETSSDFVDINCGCPIDVVCNKGCGSALLNKHRRLCDIVKIMSDNLPSRSLTIKLRTGWEEKNPTTHKLIPHLQKVAPGRISAIMIHGRSRLQRYHKLANWEYILKCAQSQDMEFNTIPIIGNGDIFSWDDWRDHQNMLSDNLANGDNEVLGLCSSAMIARGALIKPWLPKEIKDKANYDISASERLDMLKKFCNYGLEHWGSDQQGINTTRRFLLEWLSFLYRYVPLGIVEMQQKMNQRPPHFFGRCDLETLLCSSNSADWIRISEMLLGPVSDGFSFYPKHKSNSYAPETEELMNG